MDSISLSFSQDRAFDSGQEYADTWKVIAREVNLNVYVHPGGTPSTLFAQNGYEVFYCKQYPNEKASNGKPLWRIWYWDGEAIDDRPAMPAGPTPESWADIKYSFLPK